MSDARGNAGKWLVIGGSVAVMVGVVLVCYGWAEMPGDATAREAGARVGVWLGLGGFACAVVGRLMGQN